MLIPTRRFNFRDEFGDVRPTGELNNTASTSETGLIFPGTNIRTVVDTENCLSIIPNLSASIATHAGVTFGGANNACIYTGDDSCVDYPTGFNASAHKDLGRLFLQYDSNGRASWCFLGGQGGTATACLAYKDAALTVHGWNIPTAFLTTGASYTFGIHDPLAGGKLFFMGGKATAAYGDPAIWKDTAVTRSPGQLIACKINIKDVTKSLAFGFDTNKTGELDECKIRINNDTLLTYDGATAQPVAMVPADATDMVLVIALRAAGAYFFVKVGTGIYQYIGSIATCNTATLYAALAAYSAAGMTDWFRFPQRKWLPTPVLSDAFTAINGTSNDNRTADGLGHAETTGLGSGGLAVWHSPNGAIQGNLLVITPGLATTGGPLNDGNLITNGTFDDASSWTPGAGWTIGSGIVTKAASATGILVQSFTFPINTWYRVSLVSSATDYCAVLYFGEQGVLYATESAKIATAKKMSAANYMYLLAIGSTLTTFDDIVIKAITLSSCLSVNENPLVSPDVEIIAVLHRTQTGTQTGIIWGLDSKTDPQNFGLTYFDGVFIKTEICIAGVYTAIATVAVTFVDGYALRIWEAVNETTGFKEVHVYYNNVLIGAFMTLTAPQTAATNGLYAGLFSTVDTNSFDSCVIRDVWTGTVLDRLIGA